MTKVASEVDTMTKIKSERGSEIKKKTLAVDKMTKGESEVDRTKVESQPCRYNSKGRVRTMYHDKGSFRSTMAKSELGTLTKVRVKTM